MSRPMTRGFCAILAVITAAGCVSVKDPNNYRPRRETISQDYYDCAQQANTPVAGIAWNQYGGYGGVSAKVNSEMLLRCMEARNYRLRRATGGEWAAGLLLLPINNASFDANRWTVARG